MKFVFYTNSVSPHQLPLARELIRRLGVENYRYVYANEQTAERKQLGWAGVVDGCRSFTVKNDGSDKIRDWLQNAEVLLSSIRDFDLFESRVNRGMKTLYCSERWFKPIHVGGISKANLSLPGWVKMFHPRCLTMARRVATLIGECDSFHYLPMGVWADRDMEKICQVFGVSKSRYRAKRMVWGYFVEPGVGSVEKLLPRGAVRVLWVGRLLSLKRVDTIVKSVCAHADLRRKNNTLKRITLDIYGTGPQEMALRKMSEGHADVIQFHQTVSISEVRRLMREHDVYVLSSNLQEGWGAVVSEALEEGMKVLGTYEAGASATILPETNLFHAGDWRRLQMLLEGEIPEVGIGKWNARNAAEALLKV